MALWRFLDYVDSDGNNLVRQWYLDQPPQVRAAFDATIMLLGGIADWESDEVEEFKALSERHAGLGEVRFHVMASVLGGKRPFRQRYRPVGIWPPRQEFEFIFLLGCSINLQNIFHAASYFAKKGFIASLLRDAAARLRIWYSRSSSVEKVDAASYAPPEPSEPPPSSVTPGQ